MILLIITALLPLVVLLSVSNIPIQLTLSPPLPDLVDDTGVTIKFPGSPNLTFFSIYIPHDKRVRDIMKDINTLITSDVNTFLFRDFNDHHNFLELSL